METRTFKPKIEKFEILQIQARELYENGTWTRDDITDYCWYKQHGNDYGNWAQMITPYFGNYNDGTRMVQFNTQLG